MQIPVSVIQHFRLRSTRQVLVAAILVMILAVPGAAEAKGDASTGFAVSPMLVEEEIKPGDSSKHTITITNTTDEKQTFYLAKEDVTGSKEDPKASPVLVGGELDSPISGFDWLSGFPSSVSVSPGGSRDVTVTVKAPGKATGGHYAALTVTSEPKDIGDVSAQSRAAVIFMMNAGGVNPPEIVIEEVVVTEDARTIVDYVNSGDREVRPDATITYVDALTGETVSVRKAKECTTALPDSVGRCEFEAMGKGELDDPLVTRPELVVNNGLGRSAKAELPMEWSDTWSSLVLPIAGLSLLLLFALRRRRRDEEPDDDTLAL